jgi:methionine biosynthesis protein MetW
VTRPDLEAIARWVRPGARVLDLGCGDGSLLKHLWDRHRAHGYGVEIATFADRSFDHVILSETLQTIHRIEQLTREMLRVGREAIVSFPNFGYWRDRAQVLLGRMPVSDELPHQWYDTPNVHLCTLEDFEDLCARLGARILERAVLHRGRPVRVLPNLLGSIAVYRVSA